MTTQELVTSILFIVISLVILNINPLAKKFAPRIIIEVNPNYFMFFAGSQSLELQPYLYVTRDTHKIASISEEIQNNTAQEYSFLKVNLLESGNTAPNDLDKGPLLRDFLTYGIRKVITGLHFPFHIIRPIVLVKGISTLDPTLCGYQKVLFLLSLQGEALQTIFE